MPFYTPRARGGAVFVGAVLAAVASCSPEYELLESAHNSGGEGGVGFAGTAMGGFGGATVVDGAGGGASAGDSVGAACELHAECASSVCFGGTCEDCLASSRHCTAECAPFEERVEIERNGCRVCECAPISECGSSADCDAGEVCYRGQQCRDGCADPSCCFGNRCSAPGCADPSGLSCAVFGCDGGQACAGACGAPPSCECDGAAWSCAPAAAGGCEVSCAPPAP